MILFLTINLGLFTRREFEGSCDGQVHEKYQLK